MNNSEMFKINAKDFINGLVVAVFGGVFLPISALVQSGQFNIFTVDWHILGMLAVNGAITGFTGYIAKKFFSTPDGKAFGKF